MLALLPVLFVAIALLVAFALYDTIRESAAGVRTLWREVRRVPVAPRVRLRPQAPSDRDGAASWPRWRHHATKPVTHRLHARQGLISQA